MRQRLVLILAVSVWVLADRPGPVLADGGNDNTDATLIDANPYVDQGNSSGKGNDAFLSSCLSQGSDASPDAWYELNLTATSEVTIWTTCADQGPPSYDTRLAVYDGSQSIVACNDDAPDCGSPHYQSRIDTITLDPGPYWIAVDGFNGASGPYELNVVWVELGPPCVGSDSTNPTVMAQLPYMDSGDLAGDCDDVLTCNAGFSGEDHWYEVTVDTEVFMDVSTTCDAADVDTRVAILDQSLSQLYCNDDDPGCPTGQSVLDDALLAAGTYYVVVDAFFGAGTYTVSVDTTHAPPGTVQEKLPDIICREDELYDNDISTNIVPGRTHLRLSNATANIGNGKLYLYGVTPGNPDGSQDVMQRIWRTDGSTYDRLAGQFLFHPEHNHIHFEEWTIYRLRDILPGGGVGPIVAEGEKTSFCVFDLDVHDSSLPGFSGNREFASCGSTIQGLSIGWADIYSKGLEGQYIDITDVPDGTYWLEAEADPFGRVKEFDETNNSAFVPVTIGQAAAIVPDSFEPNDDLGTVDGRSVGANNSPNLGPCGPQRVINGLTVTSSNDDIYKFYNPADGQSGDEIRIDFVHGLGDLDLELLDFEGVQIALANTNNDFELISLSGQPEGWYYAKIVGFNGDDSPDYQLTIDPSSNTAPSVTVIDPPLGTINVDHGNETYDITWSASDADGNPTWVTVYVNTTPVLDGNEILLPPSLNTDGSVGMHVFNTSYVELGTYWVYCEITDGGTVTGAWSEGTLTIFDSVTAAESVPTRTTELMPNRPNPFNPATVLEFELAEPSMVHWRIYDLRGTLVRTIESRLLTAGRHSRVWNGRDDRGREVASGVYFQAIDAGRFRAREKMVLLR